MSDLRLLWLVFRYPDRTALARSVDDAAVFVRLRSLECRGLVWRHRGHDRLTRHGRDALAMTLALVRLVSRTRT